MFCINWETKRKWESRGHYEPLSGFRRVGGGKVLEKFTVFSLKLAYSLLEIMKLKLSVISNKKLLLEFEKCSVLFVRWKIITLNH